MRVFSSPAILRNAKSWRCGWCIVLLLASLAGRAQAPAWQMGTAAEPVQNATSTTVATVADASGNVYLAGRFLNTVRFDDIVLTSQGYDIFLAKWSPATRRFAWAQRIGSAGNEQAIALAINGNNLYLAGEVGGSGASFGNLTLGSFTTRTFVARFADTGSAARFDWVWQPAAPFDGQLKALAASAAGVYIAGSFTDDSLTLGATTLTNASPPGYGLSDAFVARLTDAGNSASVGWVLPIAGNNNEKVNALAVSSTGVYAAGAFNSQTLALGTTSLSSAGGIDAFVTRINDGPTPTFAWAQRAGGTDDDEASALALSGTSVYAAGSFASRTAAFGSTTLALTGSVSDVDLFVAKLTDAGTAASFAWAQRAGGVGQDNATALAASGSSVYVAGISNYTATFGSISFTNQGGSGEVYLARLTDAGSTGSFAWAQHAGGFGTNAAAAVALAGTLVYVGGTTYTPTSFGTHTVAGTFGNPQPAGFLAAVNESPLAPVLGSTVRTTGLPGEIITLNGSNLAGTTAIRFAGSGATTVSGGFSVNAAGTAISGVVVPPDAATGYLNVLTPVGSSNSLPFVVSPTPPDWQLALSAGYGVGGPYGTTVNAIATDSVGNVYLAGQLAGQGQFGSTLLRSSGGYDVFVAKWSPTAGRFMWAVRAGGAADDDIATAIAVRGTGVYITGNVPSPSATFGALTAAGPCTYVAKLTDSGSSASFSWLKQSNGYAYGGATGIAVSGASVYAVGKAGPAFQLGGVPLSSTGGPADFYVAKLTDGGSTAQVSWVTGGTSQGNALANGVAASGNQVYVAGSFGGTLTVGNIALGGASNQSYVTDSFVAKFLDAGSSVSVAWAQRGGGTANDRATAIAVEGSNIYLAGGYSGVGVFGSSTITSMGYEDAYVAKLVDGGTAGTFAWAKSAGGYLNESASAIAVRNGAVYVAGSYFSYSLYLGSSILANAYTTFNGSGNSYDIFVTKLVDEGSTARYAWAQRAGGRDHDVAFTLALAANTVYVGGRAYEPASFSPLTFPAIAGQGGPLLAALGTNAISQPLGTAANKASASFSLYPNPAHQRVLLVLPPAFAALSTTVTVLNPLGAEMQRQLLPPHTAQGAIEVALPTLPAGLYLVRLQAGGQSLTQRLVLE